MPEKKTTAAPKKATAVKKTESKAETNAKVAAKAAAAKPAAAKKTTAAAAKRAVARPVTRVARPEAERAARPVAPVERPKRERPQLRPLPTAPAGHAPVIGVEGTAMGSVALPAAFATSGKRKATLFQAFIAERANARQANASTKNRARVSGGGAKPWRQKGTGRARQGSTRSPLWRHGGVVFGPNGRRYEQRMPEKMRRAAFSEAVSALAANGRVVVIDELRFEGEGDRPRTRDVVTWLAKIGDLGSTVLVWNEANEGAARAMANLQELEVRTPGSLRLSDVLGSDTLLVMRPALEALALRGRAAPAIEAGAPSEGSRV
jgi:large subunit ribosomal protein L4